MVGMVGLVIAMAVEDGEEGEGISRHHNPSRGVLEPERKGSGEDGVE